MRVSEGANRKLPQARLLSALLCVAPTAAMVAKNPVFSQRYKPDFVQLSIPHRSNYLPVLASPFSSMQLPSILALAFVIFASFTQVLGFHEIRFRNNCATKRFTPRWKAGFSGTSSGPSLAPQTTWSSFVPEKVRFVRRRF